MRNPLCGRLSLEGCMVEQQLLPDMEDWQDPVTEVLNRLHIILCTVEKSQNIDGLGCLIEFVHKHIILDHYLAVTLRS